jgi:miniconductance mechanosensitive channel
MVEIIQKWLATTIVRESHLLFFSYLLTTLWVLIIALLINVLVKKIGLKIIHKLVLKTATNWDEIIYSKKVFHILAHIPAALVVYSFAPVFKNYEGIIQRLVIGFILIISLRAILALLDAVVDIYNSFRFAKNRPIKGFIQVVKIFFYILVGIMLLGNFTNTTTALALLSTFGGMTAVILLVFNDSILGLVASIQLTSNQSLKIGDWIEMPSHQADGDVIDISLNKIKVQNWDRTISNIPAQSFLNNSFKNWEGMVKSGGRRLKRSIYIDTTSIKFLDEGLLQELQGIELLKKYLDTKIDEINKSNESSKVSESLINGRRLTNIGTFRAYIKEYLKSHSRIKQDDIIMVRQLPPTELGLPLEIYAFTNDTAWVNYEEIQSDIFDHLLAIIGEFDLRIYQSPTGNDIKFINQKEESMSK